MTAAEQSTKVAKALERMAENVQEGFDTFNADMQAAFPDAYTSLPGEVRMQVNWAEGALTAARNYVRDRAEWCRLYGEPHRSQG